MASGMAHELNQPLTALVSYCDTAMSLLKTKSSTPQELVEILGRASEQAHRAGDIIRRIRQYKQYIGHYHVAGCPGRNEIDDTQEINYPAVMRAILVTGYDGLVSQEFIPTWKDPLAALRYCVRVCDV